MGPGLINDVIVELNLYFVSLIAQPLQMGNL